MKNRAFDYTHYIDWRDPIDLSPYGLNAKLHDDKQIKNIANSIRRFGWQQEAVITSDNVLVIGHGRRLAAIELGCKIPVKVIDKIADQLTEEDIRELRIADNQTNAETGFDYAILAKDLDGLAFDGFNFDFSTAETPDQDDTEAVDDDWDKPIPDEPVSRPGQIYALGGHRLMVGDSTNQDDVTALMGGALADCFLTDPPNNVDYTGATEDALKIQNDNMSDAAFEDFLQAAFDCADAAMKPGAAYYIWHADTNGFQFRQAIRQTGWKLRQCIIWVKNTFVLGRQDYQWKHEPCLYGWKEGTHYFIEDRTQDTVIDNKIDPKKMTKDQLIDLVSEMLGENTPQTVVYEDKPVRSLMHPTMKPVTLMGRLAKNSTRPGGLVLDLFGGSGSTMIACEQLGRRCYMMELDTRYADAIIDRWETFTGGKAVLLNG